ncbi:hypothetical protein TNCV_2599741 [Trichonephila clavipes]|nr:hypothetical protein TNCV_2599741 [Trichonephila clavipes]
MPHAFDVRRSSSDRLASQIQLTVRLRPPSPSHISLSNDAILRQASTYNINQRQFNFSISWPQSRIRPLKICSYKYEIYASKSSHQYVTHTK